MKLNRFKINDLAINVTDGEHSSVVDDINGKYYLLSNKNIKNGKVVYDNTDRKITEQSFNKINKRTKLSYDDVVIATVGSIGRSAIIKNKNLYFDFQRSVGIIKLDKNKLIPEFLHYYFQLPYVQKRLINLSSGAVQKCLFISDLKNIDIDIPEDFQTQKSIAKVLSDLDAKIELNNKINRELEAMAKMLYDYWFVQFDFPNEQGKPYKSSGGKMVYNEELKREIPEGWEVDELVKNMDVQYGFPYRTKLFNNDKIGKPVIRIRDILESTISLYSTEVADEKYQIRKGALLIGMDGNFHMNFWDKENCFLNQRCVKIEPKNKKSISTFQALFDTQPYIKAREKNVSRTTVGHLSAKDINDLKIIKATESIQLQANETFNGILNKVLSNRTENQQLTALRDWLLPMLMNGQITVGEAEEKLNMAAEPVVKYKKG